MYIVTYIYVHAVHTCTVTTLVHTYNITYIFYIQYNIYNRVSIQEFLLLSGKNQSSEAHDAASKKSFNIRLSEVASVISGTPLDFRYTHTFIHTHTHTSCTLTLFTHFTHTHTHTHSHVHT